MSLTTYQRIPNGDIDPESPVTASLVTLLRDNPISMNVQAASAPDAMLRRDPLLINHGYQSTTLAWSSSQTLSLPVYECDSLTVTGGASTVITCEQPVTIIRARDFITFNGKLNCNYDDINNELLDNSIIKRRALSFYSLQEEIYDFNPPYDDEYYDLGGGRFISEFTGRSPGQTAIWLAIRNLLLTRTYGGCTGGGGGGGGGNDSATSGYDGEPGVAGLAALWKTMSGGVGGAAGAAGGATPGGAGGDGANIVDSSQYGLTIQQLLSKLTGGGTPGGDGGWGMSYFGPSPGTSGTWNPGKQTWTTGGYGGLGAGLVIFVAPTIIFDTSAEIYMQGGAGTNGASGIYTNSGGGAGGGGGGGGNLVCVTQGAASLVENYSVLNCSGGAGGTGGAGNSGGGTGGAGGDGGDGGIIHIELEKANEL